MNRIDGDLFSGCFPAWVEEAFPGRPDLVAIDGKSLRRSHDQASGRRPLHLVSAFATRSRLVLGREAVEDKSNEITAIPALLQRLDLQGALLSIDAMGCNPATAEAITAAGADYLLAVKANQPTLHAEIEAYFDTALEGELEACTPLDKSRGRIERRTCSLSRTADWLNSARAYPRAPRFPHLAAIARIQATVEHKGRTTTERRYYICSRPLDAKACARRTEPRGHREQPPLELGRHLQGGRFAHPHRIRTPQHGRGPTLRLQPAPPDRRQDLTQDPTQGRRLGHPIPPQRPTTPLTRTRSRRMAVRAIA